MVGNLSKLICNLLTALAKVCSKAKDWYPRGRDVGLHLLNQILDVCLLCAFVDSERNWIAALGIQFQNHWVEGNTSAIM